MKKIYFSCILLAFGFSVSAQTEQDADEFVKTITKDDLNKHLSVLASDALQGRETGKAGQKMAAAYIASHFQSLGLQGPVKDGGNQGYYQPVKLYTTKPGDIYVSFGKETIKNDFNNLVYYGKGNTDNEMDDEVVFVGKGRPEDYEGRNVEGKGVMIMIDDPRAWRTPAQVAQDNKVGMLYIVNAPTDAEFEMLAGQWQHYLSGGALSVTKPKNETGGVFFLKPSVAARMIKSDTATMKAALSDKKKLRKMKTAKITYKLTQDVSEMNTENVLGYLEGTDKKDELVVLTAHYDHVGMDGEEIYNGADDDGSGTSSVLELAEAFVKAKEAGKGPRRSMLFMTVTGEEKGLLGSAYYAENPVFPLENTIVDLNIDMIGRVDPGHKDNPEYVYLVGSDRLSSELHQISEKVNETYTKLDLDYTYNDEAHPDRIYYRSDHWNFAKNNVPIIFYFNGVHEDYHKPTDTIEKINFEMLKKRSDLVFYTAWMLANRDQRIVVDKLQDQKVNNN